jgi:hypothetical protein
LILNPPLYLSLTKKELEAKAATNENAERNENNENISNEATTTEV